MFRSVLGVHHVTIMARRAAANVAFHARTLGLRLVKKTVNFDDPLIWHLYYGDRAGTPGTVLTHFPYEMMKRGERGAGEVSRVVLAARPGELERWAARLAAEGTPVAHGDVGAALGGRPGLRFEDGDGTRLGLMEAGFDAGSAWDGAAMSAGPVAFVRLEVVEVGPTAEFLGLLGFEAASGGGDTAGVLAVHGGGVGREVELVAAGDAAPARLGAGSVHHVAFRVPDRAALESARERLLSAGHRATGVLDRNYFESVYCREPGGVLIELATDGPGFAVDEPAGGLGSSLKLPAWLEGRRGEIERGLPGLGPGLGSGLGPGLELP